MRLPLCYAIFRLEYASLSRPINALIDTISNNYFEIHLTMMIKAIIFLAITVAGANCDDNLIERWRQVYGRMFQCGIGLRVSHPEEAEQMISELQALTESGNLEQNLHEEIGEVKFWSEVANFQPSACSLATDAILDERYNERLTGKPGAVCPFLLAYLRHVKDSKLEYCIKTHKEFIVSSIKRIPAESMRLIASLNSDSSSNTNALDRVAKYFAPYYRPEERAQDNMLEATRRIYKEQLAKACEDIDSLAEQVKRAAWYLDKSGALSRVDPLVGEYIEMEKFCYIVPHALHYLAQVAKTAS